MTNRRGISLIEVVVAVVLLGIIATVHTVATMRYSMRNRIAALGVSRSAAISTATDLFSTMPFSALATNSGCVDVTTPANYPHERCVTVTAVTGSVVRVQIIITPDNTALRPDTVRVDRSQPPSGSLFS